MTRTVVGSITPTLTLEDPKATSPRSPGPSGTGDAPSKIIVPITKTLAAEQRPTCAENQQPCQRGSSR